MTSPKNIHLKRLTEEEEEKVLIITNTFSLFLIIKYNFFRISIFSDSVFHLAGLLFNIETSAQDLNVS